MPLSLACASLVNGLNVEFRAINKNESTITCTDFPNYIPFNFDTLYICASDNITFHGIRFERCGPVPSNLFISRSSDILIDSCTFL